MLCPKCGREMAAGYLQSGPTTDITWVSKLLPAGLGYWRSDSLPVSCGLKPGIQAVPAHICKTCRIFLGDYSQN